MKSKWILLNEIELELVKHDEVVRMFEFKDHAVAWAERHIWMVGK